MSHSKNPRKTAKRPKAATVAWQAPAGAPLLLSTAEAARVLRLSKTSLDRDRLYGRLRVPYIRLGRRTLYRMADLEAWLESRRVVPSYAES